MHQSLLASTRHLKIPAWLIDYRSYSQQLQSDFDCRLFIFAKSVGFLGQWGNGEIIKSQFEQIKSFLAVRQSLTRLYKRLKQFSQ